MTVIPFPSVSTKCSGHTMPGLTAPELRERALANYYAAERNNGVDPLTANERMQEFAKRLDAIDYDRDLRKHEPRPRDNQRYAVASLIGECEAIVASGNLPEPTEQSLRVLIAHALAAFGMASKSERRTA